MNIALAQIDMRLGDIDAICARIEDQAALASGAGARLLCVPAPLMSGLMPGALADYPNFEHDLLRALSATARAVAGLGVVCLVPASVACENGPYFEVFLLRGGHAVPFRRTLLHLREDAPMDPWLPAVFDLDGTRVAVTFDFDRDIERLPPGCDLVLFFQVNPFTCKDLASVAVAGLADGRISKAVAHAGVWMAHVAPLGGFDDVVYTGGSYVMDDCGRVVAAAPSFEESLLVQDVRRGAIAPALDSLCLPSYDEQEWVWQALRLHVADAVQAAGASQVMVPLTGSLPSALLAALAVDALGSRNVLALFSERPDALTPAEEAVERARVERVRAVAARLHVRLIEHGAGDLPQLLDRPVARREVGLVRGDVEALQFIDAARTLGALPLCSFTKTAYALAATALAPRSQAALAPFGDLYLSDLEFLARRRNRSSAVLPRELTSSAAVEDAFQELVRLAGASCGGDEGYAVRVRDMLEPLGAMEVDGVLRAHVDQNQPFESIALSTRKPEAVALLLMLVRRNEAARRRLPPYPIIAARSFAERSWPLQLAWSDLGRHGAELQTLDDAASAALERYEHSGEERNALVRDEVLGFIGGLMGLSPAQIDELSSEEGQRRIQEGMQRFEEQLMHLFEQLGEEGELPDGLDLPGMSGGFTEQGPGSTPSFSQN